MLVWVLMALDSLAVFSLSSLQFNLGVPWNLVLLSGVYLMGKGFVFRDAMSLVDAVCGVYILFSFLLGLHIITIYYLVIAWFIYKFVSLLITLA